MTQVLPSRFSIQLLQALQNAFLNVGVKLGYVHIGENVSVAADRVAYLEQLVSQSLLSSAPNRTIPEAPVRNCLNVT